MACRVGMTTELEERKKHWERLHPTLANWRVLSQHNSKTAAQEAETEAAQRLGCVSSPGGDGPEYARWSVYYFTY